MLNYQPYNSCANAASSSCLSEVHTPVKKMVLSVIYYKPGWKFYVGFCDGLCYSFFLVGRETAGRGAVASLSTGSGMCSRILSYRYH